MSEQNDKIASDMVNFWQSQQASVPPVHTSAARDGGFESWLTELRVSGELTAPRLSETSRALLLAEFERKPCWDRVRIACDVVNRADAAPVTIKRGPLDFFKLRIWSADGRHLLVDAWSFPRCLRVGLAFLLFAYLLAPWLAPVMDFYAANGFGDYKWVIQELKWLIVAGLFGTETVRVLKNGGGFSAFASSTSTASHVPAATQYGKVSIDERGVIQPK